MPVQLFDLQIEPRPIQVVPERIKKSCVSEDWTGNIGQWMEEESMYYCKNLL